MRATLFVFAMTACAAWGQDVTRVFHFHHVDKAQDLNEVGTMMRTIAEVRQLTVDPAQKSMSLSAPAAQIEIAEWMFNELDRSTMPAFATKEFKASGDDDVVRIFFIPHAATIQGFQEIATAVRTITEMRRVFTYNASRALAVRGTADQIAGTEVLVRELDQPETAKRADSGTHKMVDPRKFGMTDVRVFYAPYASTVQQFQEVATMVRTIGDIRQVFTYNAPKAVVVRGTPDQVALADWMVHELGKPVTAERAESATYTYPIDSENTVRVFYVKDTPTVADLQEVATQIRAAAKIRRAFTYNESRAITLRGTPEQIAQAEQILKERQVAQALLK